MWRAEGNWWEVVLSFHCVSSRDGRQVPRRGDKLPYTHILLISLLLLLFLSLNTVSDALPVYASILQAEDCNSVFVEQANIWMDG